MIRLVEIGESEAILEKVEVIEPVTVVGVFQRLTRKKLLLELFWKLKSMRIRLLSVMMARVI